MSDPTRRFSSRVENYIRYRPGYPRQIMDVLIRDCGLRPEHMIADVGSGTGILTEMFLRNGNQVWAIEPNREMREAAERLLGTHPGFHSVDGRAEETTLADTSADFVTAGQAFHWFDPARTRAEFARILKPAGWVVLVWNERKKGATRFLVAYEELLRRFALDYHRVDHTRIDRAALAAFFGGPVFRSGSVPNRQELDLDGLKGRLLSSSYTPEPGHPQHTPMLTELSRIFQAHHIGGRVRIEYRTVVHYGRLD